MSDITVTQKAIIDECDSIKKMLLEKNKKYNDSAVSPRQVFSKVSAEEGILCRIDDKINRIIQGDKNEDEDVWKDLTGYFVLLMVARKLQRDRNKIAPCASCKKMAKIVHGVDGREYCEACYVEG